MQGWLILDARTWCSPLAPAYSNTLRYETGDIFFFVASLVFFFLTMSSPSSADHEHIGDAKEWKVECWVIAATGISNLSPLRASVRVQRKDAVVGLTWRKHSHWRWMLTLRLMLVTTTTGNHNCAANKGSDSHADGKRCMCVLFQTWNWHLETQSKAVNKYIILFYDLTLFINVRI